MDDVHDTQSEEDASDDGLQIVLESPKQRRPRKRKQFDINQQEKEMLERMETELEEAIEEKATKNNLSVVNVKKILREVASNEHVVAMMCHGEDPEGKTEPPFEPKITRAKAKELYSASKNLIPLAWLPPPKPPSEVQKLITDDLAEDSSGDEYVPAEEESEDDRDSSFFSESDTQSPATPIKPPSPAAVNWTDDGIFKIPPIKVPEDTTEEPNIALRTRSKVSYSATPLEVLEEAFIPPDITTDMYDMDCDDDVYKEFLRKFTRPLDEVTKPNEDEELDPEYNILADEEEVDTEELRADKAVKITRKEVNELMAELFEYANAFVEEQENKDNSSKLDLIDTSLRQAEVNMIEKNLIASSPPSQQDYIVEIKELDPDAPPVQNTNEENFSQIIKTDQRLLLAQQMRQYVQILTQQFLLTFAHPEFHEHSAQFKENLINLQLLSQSNDNSAFKPCNLDGAVDLIKEWEELFALDTDEVRAAKQYVAKVVNDIKTRYMAGNPYVPTFPPLLLEKVSTSSVFIYPGILPRIPFKPANVIKESYFTNSEDELIALGMEQFTPYLARDGANLTFKGEVKLNVLSKEIVRYMLPSKDIRKLYCHICNNKHHPRAMNPIKYFFQHGKAPATLHYVIDLKEFGVLPPCRRSKNSLPYQWTEYVYPEEVSSPSASSLLTCSTFTKVPKPPAFNRSFTRSSPKRRLAPKAASPSAIKNLAAQKSVTPSRNTSQSPSLKRPRQPFRKLFNSTPKQKVVINVVPAVVKVFPVAANGKKLEHYFKSPSAEASKEIQTCLRCMKFNSSIFERFRSGDMLPSMPFLGTPRPNRDDDFGFSESPGSNINNANETKTEEVTEAIVEADSTIIDGCEFNNEADDILPDSTPLASKSINSKTLPIPTTSKEKDFYANLALLSAEDPDVIQEKSQSFAQAYFDKARERLSLEEYEKFTEILNSFNEGTNSVRDLYKQMEIILGHQQDLLDEFLTFLTPAQAKDIGKLIPYYILSNMSLFLRKLEIYFKEQPAQLRKIYRSLADLSTCMNVTMDRVKGTILPLLKGNSLLTDWFLQIFPTEPPPASLLRGAWEDVHVKKELGPNEGVYETIVLPDSEDPYGGPNCICSCHQRDDVAFKTRAQHCTPCGIKFLQGRVYIQTGKGLRSANVSFSGSPDVDHNSRLNCTLTDRRKRRSETSPSKQLTSPLKDQDEARLINDSEDETDGCKKKSRLSRTPKRKRIKLDKTEKADKQAGGTENCDIVLPAADSITPEEQPSPVKDAVQDATSGEECTDLIKPAEEPVEWDCNTSIESVELRLSPEHSAESESEFLEESSQDNINTETDESAEELESLSNSPVHSENSNSNAAEETWTRDEDKAILETLQKDGNKEDSFVHISEVLGNRTVAQIKERFQTLMSLLQKMASTSSSVF